MCPIVDSYKNWKHHECHSNISSSFSYQTQNAEVTISIAPNSEPEDVTMKDSIQSPESIIVSPMICTPGGPSFISGNEAQCNKTSLQSNSAIRSPQTSTAKPTSAMAVQTSPTNLKCVVVSLKKPLNEPLHKNEEQVYTHLTRCKLKFPCKEGEKDVIKCKTEGKPFHLLKIRKAQKCSNIARSPLKKRRSNAISKVRSFISGANSIQTQQSSELKCLTKQSKLQVCEQAGVKDKAKFSFKQQLAFKSGTNKEI